jgi:hypothetical protein
MEHEKPNANEATSLMNMITSKQLAMIRALAREADVDGEAECRQLMGCSIDLLSKSAAKDLIEHLQNIQGGTE